MRSAQNQAQTAAKTASDTGAKYSAAGDQISSSLIPGLEREANTPEGFTPEQLNNQVVAGEQGAGGAVAGITGEADLEAARKRNSAGYTAALDEAARDKTKQISENNLNIQTKSDELGQEKQMAAQKELGGLYGTDVEANLKAQGLVPEDVNSEVNADKSGWFQNMTSLIASLGGAAQGAGSMGLKIPCWIAAAVFDGWEDERTHLVRTWILAEFPKSVMGRWALALYMRFGESVANALDRFPVLKPPFRWLFSQALKKAKERG